MDHLNFCRQVTRQFNSHLANDLLTPEGRAIYTETVADLAKSEKFMLPDGGRLLNDREYRALDESEPLHLPYPIIALEYRRSGPARLDSVESSKAIVVARETDTHIALRPVFWIAEHEQWYALKEAKISRTDYLERSSPESPVVFKLDTPDDVRSPEDYDDELGCLMDFLNALQCSNVRRDLSGSQASGRKIKSALPFDSYYVLSVSVGSAEGSNGEQSENHRSPREHLRRGHIRRYASGLRIWVNAAVINAGIGGTILKDYRLVSSSDRTK